MVADVQQATSVVVASLTYDHPKLHKSLLRRLAGQEPFTMHVFVEVQNGSFVLAIPNRRYFGPLLLQRLKSGPKCFTPWLRNNMVSTGAGVCPVRMSSDTNRFVELSDRSQWVNMGG